MRVALLLRGVNIGQGSRVPMAALRSVAAELGHTEVKTVLQSGNLVLSPCSPDLEAVAAGLERAVAGRLGVETAVIGRAHHDLRAALERNPFAAEEPEPTRLHVVFLDRPADPAAVARLDPHRSPGDRFLVDGATAWLHLPSGSARTRLTVDWFERELDLRATARNARTVERLVALTAP